MNNYKNVNVVKTEVQKTLNFEFALSNSAEVFSFTGALFVLVVVTRAVECLIIALSWVF